MHHCRLCNRHKRSIHPLFKVLKSKAKVRAGSLRDQILKYVGVKIDFEDSLPSVICSDCRNRVIQWNRFVIKCKKVQLILNATPGTTHTDKPDAAESPKSTLTAMELSNQKSESSHDVVNLSPSPSPTTPNTANTVPECRQDEVVCSLENVDRTPILAGGLVSIIENDFELPTSVDVSVLIDNAEAPVSVIENDFESPTSVDVSAHIDNAEAPVSVIENDFESPTSVDVSVRIDNAETPPVIRRDTCSIEKSQSELETEQIGLSKVVQELTGVACAQDEGNNDREPKVKAFSCKHCSKNYKSKFRFKEHISTVHDAPTEYFCDQCSKVFTLRKSLETHKQTHNATRNFCCQFCGYTFQTIAALRSHMTVHRAGYARFVCATCGKDFKLRQQLGRHELTHREERTHACPHCPLAFVARHNLTRHIKIIHGPPPALCCPTCDKQFRHPQHFRTHLLRHAGVRDKKCDACDKMFVTRHSLMKHLKVHARDKKYKCPSCPKSFSDCTNHKRHLQKHSARASPPAAPSCAPSAAPDPDSKTYARLETYQPPLEMVELMSAGEDEYAHMDMNEFLPSEECVGIDDDRLPDYSTLTLKTDGGGLKEADMADFGGDIRLFSTGEDGFEMGMFLEM